MMAQERKPLQSEEIPLREMNDTMNDLDHVSDIRGPEFQYGPEVPVHVENPHKMTCNGRSMESNNLSSFNINPEQNSSHSNQSSHQRQQHSNLPEGLNLLLFVKNLEQIKRSVQQLDTLLQRRCREIVSFRASRKHWKTLAIALDRVFFILYVILIILSIVILFPRPNWQEDSGSPGEMFVHSFRIWNSVAPVGGTPFNKLFDHDKFLPVQLLMSKSYLWYLCNKQTSIPVKFSD